MDKITERETHDLMNVQSFSQLPFIRPAPPIKEKGIRLFGIEFGGGVATTTDDSESAETNNNNAFETDSTTTNNKDINNNNNNSNSNENNVESNRRFECHYCCRNFPTSQALGGHQNAHKRERQHAKRAHLQSTMVHATSFSSDPHLFQHHHHNPFINYRFNSSSPSSSSPTSYPTWNSNNSASSLLNGSAARFYGTHSHSHAHVASSYSQPQQQQQQQPINGSPLAFWRIPSGVVHSNSNSNPSFNNHERSLQPLLAVDERNSSFSQVGPSAASQNRYVYDSKRSVDHVSLDLHL